MRSLFIRYRFWTTLCVGGITLTPYWVLAQTESVTLDVNHVSYEIVPTNAAHAPFVLRRKNNTSYQDYPLPFAREVNLLEAHDEDDLFDLSMFDLQLSVDGETLVISYRYEAVLYHPDSLQISGLVRPGEQMEYGEDAISGTLGGLRYENGFLIGNAVGYGLFCMDMTNWAAPIELLRISNGEENNGQPYLFLKENKEGRWDGFTAASDTAFLSPHLNRHYTRTFPLQTVFTQMQIGPNVIRDPLEKPVSELELRDATGKLFRLDIGRLEWK